MALTLTRGWPGTLLCRVSVVGKVTLAKVPVCSCVSFVQPCAPTLFAATSAETIFCEFFDFLILIAFTPNLQ